MTSIAIKTKQYDREAGSPGETCRPRPLVQPRFFPDQILNDADLNALVAWAGEKAQLHRYREGWGVVCGLRVGLAAGGDRLAVAPGYAIDSCGRDVIVCTDDCRRAEIAVRDLFAGLDAACAPGEGEFTLACYRNNRKYIRVVDVSVHYRATGEASRPTRGCEPVRCQNSRTREGYELVWREGQFDDDPQKARVEEWQDNVAVTFKSLFIDRVRLFADRPPDPQLLSQLTAALREASAAAGGEFPLALLSPGGATVDELIRCAFWVALDCLIAAIGHACAACDPAAGVPLARVWLQTHDPDGRRNPRVLLVDNAPPFRRLLHADPYPAPLGGLSLAPYYWRRTADVIAALREAGVGAIDVPIWTMPGNLEDLLAWTISQLNNLYMTVDHPVTIQTWQLGPNFGDRVVGIATIP